MDDAVATRTCVGCRGKDQREALMRFVLAEDPLRLLPDVRHRLPGRGVSVHARWQCVRLAARRGAFAAAFRRPLAPDPVTLAREARDQYVRRAEGLLSAAQRAGKAALGFDAVSREMERRTVQLLVVAEDAASSRDEITRAAERLGSRCLVFSTKQRLGEVFGRAPVGIVAIRDSGIAEALVGAADSAAQLAEDA
jgi:predicted RNA-binding protein YlxR (DUF448 family)/ribosomal protein L30E